MLYPIVPLAVISVPTPLNVNFIFPDALALCTEEYPVVVIE